MPLQRLGIGKQYLIQRLETRRRALQAAVSTPSTDGPLAAGAPIDTYGAPIELETIQKMRQAYEEERLKLIKTHIKQPSSNKAARPIGFEDAESCWFDKEIILRLLNQPGCVGLRIHYGIQTELEGEKGYHNVILVGLREDHEKLRLESAEGLRTRIERTGSAAHYYKDMLSEEGDAVIIPRGRQQAKAEAQSDNACDFGGLGPPLPGPASSLDA